MAVLANARDACESTTTSSDNGVFTPTATDAATSTDPDGEAIQEWLRSSKTSSGSSLNNDHQDSGVERIGSLKVTCMSDPLLNDTLLIVDRSQNRALTCRHGHLHFEDVNAIDSEQPIPPHWQWLCTEKDGSKGFQSVAEGTFLGHDFWWNFNAKMPHHEGWECFTLNRREGGYYWIQALYFSTLWQVSARPGGSGCFAEWDGGTLWEFVKVHLHVPGSR